MEHLLSINYNQKNFKLNQYVGKKNIPTEKSPSFGNLRDAFIIEYPKIVV